MKKFFQIGTVVCGLLITQFAFSQDNSAMQQGQRAGANQAQTRWSDQKQNSQMSGQQSAQTQGKSGSYDNQGGQGRSGSYDNQGGQTQGRYGSYDNVQKSGSHSDGYRYQYGTPGSGEQCVYCPQDQACGDCWCMYVHYEPCYYTTQRCIEEQIPCKKTCCRYCDQYYEVQKCRMVPQYYCETCCRKVPEYYEVDDCKCCKKWVCDQHCEYVPKYYWKHVCNPSCQ